MIPPFKEVVRTKDISPASTKKKSRGLARKIRTPVITDKMCAALGIVLCLGLMVPLFMTDAAVMFALPAVLTLVLCVVWVFIRKGEYHREAMLRSRRATVALSAGFFILLAVIIMSLQVRTSDYERPLLFFVAVALMPAVLTLEAIYSTKKEVPYVLLQAITLALILSWSMLVLFPNVIGVDPWFHQMLTNQTVATGQVPTEHGYSGIPFFHILLGSSAILTGMEYKMVSMLVLIAVQLISEVLLIFLIAMQTFKSHKIALLSSVVVTFAGLSIHMSYEPTPTTLAFIFVLLSLFLMLREDRWTVRLMGLVVLLFFSIVFTHSVTAVCMILSIFVGAVVLKLRWLVPKVPMSVGSVVMLTFLLVITVGWWTYGSELLPQLKELFDVGFNKDYFGVSSMPTAEIPVIETILKWAGMMLYFSLSILGVLHAISRRGNLKAIYVSVLGMCFLAMGMVALTAHLGLLEDRWWYFAQIILAVPLGATVFFISNMLYRRRRSGLTQPILAVGVASLAVISIISPAANIDNPLIFPNSGIRYAFTEAELRAASFSTTSTVDVVISSDSDFMVNPSSSVLINYYVTNPDLVTSLDESLMTGNFSSDGSLQIIRTVIYDKPLRLEGEVYRLNYDLNGRLLASDLSRVYSNGGAESYV